MIHVLKRLAIPALVAVALVATTVVHDRFSNDDLPDPEPRQGEAAPAPATPVFSFRRAPELLTPTAANDELLAGITAWVETLPENSCFVASSGGERFFEHQPNRPLSPASNMKILTAVAALEALGPDFTFSTRIAARTLPDENGVLDGDLYIIGGGDPVLMTDAYAAVQRRTNNAVRTNADDLADQTVAVNLSEIRGSVLVDDNRYDAERSVDTWPERFLTGGQVGVLGAAVVDDGFLGFADAYASQDVSRNSEPPPLPRADDPAAQFASNFGDLLRARNVIIRGTAGRSEETPRRLRDLLVFESPPLSEIVAQMLTNSDNTTAELLIKEIGFATSERGSTSGGTVALSTIIEGLGASGDGLLALDGSGLSDGNTATCGLLHDLLDLPTHRPVLQAGMAVAGETGTLARSFRNGPGDGRIRAKTGYLAQASALSGYFTTDRGIEVTFSLIINTNPQREITPEDIDQWQRPLPRLLAPYPAGPALADIAPIGSAAASG